MKRLRSIAIATLAAVLPSVLVGFVGCSSEDLPEPDPQPRPVPDPGGTYGAEVALRVIGRGRVEGTLGDLACPSLCFARLVYRDAATAGTTDRVTLTATPSKNARFAGWSFDVAPLAARGRGPDECSPIKRAAASPAVDPRSPSLALPFGMIAGTPPPGREAQCASFLDVPLAYNVTATFEEDLLGDAGRDGDADAGPDPDRIFVSPVAGAEGREIGVYATGARVYWRLDLGTQTFVARAGQLLQPSIVANSASNGVTVFDVGPLITWQTADGALHLIRASNGDTFATTIPPDGTICRGLTSTASSLICRTNDSIISWDPFGGSRTVVHTGLPAVGTAIAHGGTAIFVTDEAAGINQTSIVSVPPFGDGGVPTIQDVVTGLPRPPQQLQVNSSNVFWLDVNGGAGRARFAPRNTGTPLDIGTAPLDALKFLRLDPIDTATSFVATSPTTGAGVILQAQGTTTSLYRSNTAAIGGIAVDQTSVYWTQKNGNVYALSRTPF